MCSVLDVSGKLAASIFIENFWTNCTLNMAVASFPKKFVTVLHISVVSDSRRLQSSQHYCENLKCDNL